MLNSSHYVETSSELERTLTASLQVMIAAKLTRTNNHSITHWNVQNQITLISVRLYYSKTHMSTVLNNAASSTESKTYKKNRTSFIIT